MHDDIATSDTAHTTSEKNNMPPKLANGVWPLVCAKGSSMLECQVCYAIAAQALAEAMEAYRRRPRNDADDDDGVAAPVLGAVSTFDKSNMQRVMQHVATAHGMVGTEVAGQLNDLRDDAKYKAWIANMPELRRRGFLRAAVVNPGQPTCDHWQMKPKADVNKLIVEWIAHQYQLFRSVESDVAKSVLAAVGTDGISTRQSVRAAMLKMADEFENDYFSALPKGWKFGTLSVDIGTVVNRYCAFVLHIKDHPAVVFSLASVAEMVETRAAADAAAADTDDDAEDSDEDDDEKAPQDKETSTDPSDH